MDEEEFSHSTEYPGVPTKVTFPAIEMEERIIVFVPKKYTYIKAENILMLVDSNEV